MQSLSKCPSLATLLALAVGLGGSFLANASEVGPSGLYVFESGTTISSSEMNHNFNTVANGASRGGDTWTQVTQSAYQAHPNDCASSMSFVEVGGSGLGFCVERNSRSAVHWVAARQDCADEGMRLLEPAEYIHACINADALGLSGMTDGWEFASNTATVGLFSTYGLSRLTVMSLGGNNGCFDGGGYELAEYGSSDDGTLAALPYRCVR